MGAFSDLQSSAVEQAKEFAVRGGAAGIRPDDLRRRSLLANSWNIRDEYDWTSIPRNNLYRQEAPSAYVTAYELGYSQLQQMVDGYVNLVEANAIANARNAYGGTGPGAGMTFYRNIYKPKSQIGNFNFPFFGDSIRSFSNEYQDTFSPISQRGAKFLGAETIEGLAKFGERNIGGAVAGLNEMSDLRQSNPVSTAVANAAEWGKGKVSQGFNALVGRDVFKADDSLGNPGMQTVGSPGNYIETPQFYQYSNTDSALDINFVLSNTINGAEGYLKNQKFITEFTKMNRPRRLGAIGMTFPAIYHVEVPGLRYIEWAYLSNFTIGLLGTRRKIGNKILPEAFQCSFSFRSLTVEAANFMDEVDNIGPYDTSDSGYLALRKKADESAKRTLDDEQRAAEARKKAIEAAAKKRREEAAEEAAEEVGSSIYLDPRSSEYIGEGSNIYTDPRSSAFRDRVPASDLPEFDRPLEDFGGPGNLLD